MAEMKRELERILERDFMESIESRKKYGSLPMSIPDEVVQCMSRYFAEYWDAGHSVGLNEARRIIDEVVGKTIRDELKKHPRMRLETYAKQYGYIKEGEK